MEYTNTFLTVSDNILTNVVGNIVLLVFVGGCVFVWRKMMDNDDRNEW